MFFMCNSRDCLWKERSFYVDRGIFVRQFRDFCTAIEGFYPGGPSSHPALAQHWDLKDRTQFPDPTLTVVKGWIRDFLYVIVLLSQIIGQSDWFLITLFSDKPEWGLIYSFFIVLWTKDPVTQTPCFLWTISIK